MEHRLKCDGEPLRAGVRKERPCSCSCGEKFYGYDATVGRAYRDHVSRARLMTPAPVFGPERPNAAVAAIRVLEDAQREYDSYGGFAPASVIRRLRVARATRAQYAEYGDTFRGH